MPSGVEFEEDKMRYGRPPGFVGQNSPTNQYVPTGNEPPMVRWLMRHGLSKSPISAQIILVVVVLINIAITYFIIKNFL